MKENEVKHKINLKYVCTCLCILSKSYVTLVALYKDKNNRFYKIEILPKEYMDDMLKCTLQNFNIDYMPESLPDKEFWCGYDLSDIMKNANVLKNIRKLAIVVWNKESDDHTAIKKCLCKALGAKYANSCSFYLRKKPVVKMLATIRHKHSVETSKNCYLTLAGKINTSDNHYDTYCLFTRSLIDALISVREVDVVNNRNNESKVKEMKSKYIFALPRGIKSVTESEMQSVSLPEFVYESYKTNEVNRPESIPSKAVDMQGNEIKVGSRVILPLIDNGEAKLAFAKVLDIPDDNTICVETLLINAIKTIKRLQINSIITSLWG